MWWCIFAASLARLFAVDTRNYKNMILDYKLSVFSQLFCSFDNFAYLHSRRIIDSYRTIAIHRMNQVPRRKVCSALVAAHNLSPSLPAKLSRLRNKLELKSEKLPRPRLFLTKPNIPLPSLGQIESRVFRPLEWDQTLRA